jgi:hypothetical protein
MGCVTAMAFVIGVGGLGYAASGLPGETGSTDQPQGSGQLQGQPGDQQQLEKQRRQEGIGTSGNLDIQDKGIRPANPPADPSKSEKVKDEQVMLGSAQPVIRGEVLRVDGDKYTVKDPTGKEVHLVVNQNTRMDCGPGDALTSFNPKDQSASDSPSGQQPQGQEKLQDLARTQQQPGSEVGATQRGSASSGGGPAVCAFKPGDKIEAEVSDMGAATMIKKVSKDMSKGAPEKGTGLAGPQ